MLEVCSQVYYQLSREDSATNDSQRQTDGENPQNYEQSVLM